MRIPITDISEKEFWLNREKVMKDEGNCIKKSFIIGTKFELKNF
jgi:hypothetical protein